MQGLQEYSLNPKVHHRRMVWNKIAKRFKGIRKHATGVVLAGPEPVDAECLRKVGFNTNNFVFFDFDESHVKAARKNGLTAFCGNVFEYLIVSKQHIDILHLDFCCGFKHEIANGLIRLMLCGCITNDTIVYINMQRGRDEGKSGFFQEDTVHLFQNGDFVFALERNVPESKNRGEKIVHFISTTLMLMSVFVGIRKLNNLIELVEEVNWGIEQIKGECSEETAEKNWNKKGYSLALELLMKQMQTKDEVTRFLEKEAQVRAWLEELMNPSLDSYRSNQVYMDSVIFQWPCNWMASEEAANKIRESVKTADLMRRVAACKAVQTMRQN